ncbi:efflux RND transporter periplasmic adaptor subunit [Burkholderiaceae bacterium FT117]|uniref:efflux RND transporter periplasmic adaptor subunit n=1 Tax=Zeimonas sediminis TaxID=2944268 RepID=UPI00234321D9|nr:efflux RND transporter periplasmic adaptor subunit [Zeimonas sediminis]MCM5571109.1 efflux RND transporter periplasmic adaptor subunit [Zeimonas sediminis]
MNAKLDELLEGANPRWWRRPAPWITVLLLAAIAGGAWWWAGRQQTAAAPRYVTEEARLGDLTLTVTANGKLQATRTVNIGSELSGTVRAVHVDVNDRVRKGQVLVELDTAKLSAQVARSRASLAAAQARLAQTVATVKEAEASLARLQEVSRLSGGKVPSAAELDAARAALERARADENSARANVQDAKAALSNDETSLSKAAIKSPIDGMVLSRTVEPGNAVAATLQAVTLMSIAEDLTRLLVEVSVDEADVGAVQVGQKASFTVSAYPQRRYPATVTRVAYGSTLTENVVTYATRLEVDNADLSLRPGMTVSASITAAERKGALLVPNTALRFSPAQAGGAAAGGGQAQSSGGIVSKLMPRPPRTGGGRSARPDASAGPARQVWVLSDGAPQRVAVLTGISDGRMTEIVGGDLRPGMAVIVDQLAGGAAK